jgi:hypothetical protein
MNRNRESRRNELSKLIEYLAIIGIAVPVVVLLSGVYFFPAI